MKSRAAVLHRAGVDHPNVGGTVICGENQKIPAVP
jgi:hypothetical protein